MYREIEIGGVKLNLLANGATPYIYKNVFKKDLIVGMRRNQAKTDSKDADEAEIAAFNLIDLGTKAAYIMNKQAEGANLSKLNEADFYKWLEAFGATTFVDDDKQAEIYSVLLDDMEESSEAKNT